MAREKKELTDMSVEEKLKSLYQLQVMLSEIDKIKTLRGELPLEVQDLEDEIEGLGARSAKMENEIGELRSFVSEKRNDMQDAQALIDRYKEQLNNVRNNREYDTLSKEIEFQSLEMELCGKKIQEANQAITEKQAEVDRCHVMAEERAEDLEAKKLELDEIVAETKQEEERLREKAKALEMTIEPRLLTAFKRIRKNARNGLGVVYVQRDACGGCFNRIPPQRVLDIRMHKKVIVCEYCGRIMVDAELAGVKMGKAAEEKPIRKKRAIRRKSEE